MHDRLLHLYLMETGFHVNTLSLAAQGFDAREPEPGTPMDDATFSELWLSLQTMVLAVGNLSKLLWGSGGRRSDEREPIREAIGVRDEALLSRTAMRNSFEHWDERVERWFRENPDRHFVDVLIGPARPHVPGLDDTMVFRQFNPETGEMTFWGESLNLRQALKEAQELVAPVNRELERIRAATPPEGWSTIEQQGAPVPRGSSPSSPADTGPKSNLLLPMNRRMLFVYLSELESQMGFFNIAIDRCMSTVRDRDRESESVSATRLWSGLQTVAVACANISKIL